MSEVCLNHIEEYWKSRTVASNTLFNEEKYTEALAGYKEALYRAEVLNNHFETCKSSEIPFIQIYMISCNNMAFTYLEMKQQKKAEAILRRSMYYLLHQLRKKAMKDCKIMLQKELQRASVSYLHHIDKANRDTQLVTLLESMRATEGKTN
ncbi:hypothetical protein SAMN02927921_00424 [Sinomicrobium oceani]|uniref:Tetratricopeptide repeat-containing protein n=1 Tax=Sinomicrobium oceani TaxID=1150368 RepID=A0A1K1M6H4_9FLAO|nr:hypothetical protein [Sinomicrobium oceani]SFW18744.1 hypothetical protein SAMN02927921_00424 [Sinomicrobium oceani]